MNVKINKGRVIIWLLGLMMACNSQPDTITEATVNNRFLSDGAVDYVDYMGGQPDLIEGVSLGPAIEEPCVRHLYFVNEHTIALTIDANYVERAGLLPYKAEPTDSVILNRDVAPMRLAEVIGVAPFIPEGHENDSLVHIQRFVYRNGEKLGWLVGKDYTHYWPGEKLLGDDLNIEAAMEPEQYTFSSKDDENFKEEIHPEKVYRKSIPYETARIGPNYDNISGMRHTIFLEFDQSITEGKRYNLDFLNRINISKPLTFTADSRKIRSEAIQVNLAGYVPNQAPKLAYLSVWMGDGGPVEYAQKEFELIDQKTGETVYTGDIKIKSSPDKMMEHIHPNFGADNYEKTFVYTMDFTDFTKPGSYLVWVDGVGVSFPLSIDEDTYLNAFKVQMRGFLHNRSGVEMKDPYTTYRRPRNMHPDDGHIAYNCDKEIFYDESLYSGYAPIAINPFSRIATSIQLDSPNEDAWGGWMDAADYDRRYPHLEAVHVLLEVYEMNPDFFRDMDLSIPESGSAIPDLISEARWGMSVFKRTQKEDGEICYGVETISHPSGGECSWNESLPAALVPGAPYVGYLYAATAAHMGIVLKEFDDKLAQEYIQTAIKAIEWADANIDDSLYAKAPYPTAQQIADAVAYLYEATGDDKWNDRFIEQYDKIASDNDFKLSQQTFRGLVRYMRLEGKGLNVNEEAISEIKVMLTNSADALLALSEKMTYGEYEDFDYGRWFVELNDSPVLLNAFLLTNDDRYLNAMVKAGDFGLGANALNVSYTTGIGERFIYQWDAEALFTNQPVATGIGAVGPTPFPRTRELPDGSFFWDKNKKASVDRYMYPGVEDWPVRETYFEQSRFPCVNEFTVMQNLSDQAYRWGFYAWYFRSMK